MDTLAQLMKTAKGIYDGGGRPLAELRKVAVYAIRKLQEETTWVSIGATEGREYYILVGPNKSRPIVRNSYIEDYRAFERRWNAVVASVDPTANALNCAAEEANAVLYTAAIAVAAAFDVWKPMSRKTPGTFFEVVLGSVIGSILSTYERTKHVRLPYSGDDAETPLSTDIVLTRPDQTRSLVIPAKITTRERIVQPYAHQRILDSVFGQGRYVSILVCVSETQRDEEKDRANMICVPGTVRLFQQHLAALGGIYYLDPPARYLAEDVARVVQVGTLGTLLTERLKHLC